MKKALLSCLILFVILVVGGCGPTPPPTPDRELEADANAVALWHFNESSGQTLADSSGNGRDLVLGADASVSTDDPTIVSSGRSGFGNCLSFNAAQSQYAYRASGHSLVNHSITLEFWMKTANDANPRVLFKGSGVDFDVSMYDHSIQMGVGDGSSWIFRTVVTPTVDDDNWHYIACTYDYATTTARIYIDGTQVLFDDSVDRAIPDLSQYDVGGRPGNTFFNGCLDEMRISDNVRTASEISDYYDRATQ